MTSDTPITPKTNRGLTPRRRTIFSVMGIALVMSLLRAGFATAISDKAPTNDIITNKYQSMHRVDCLSDTQQSPPIRVSCPHSGGYGYDQDMDRTACITQCGISVKRIMPGTYLAR